MIAFIGSIIAFIGSIIAFIGSLITLGQAYHLFSM